MPFRAGQTFLFPLSAASTAHLWVIATEPNSEDVFVVVSLTTLREAQDQTVLFRKDEHPFLRHDTCACYALAETMTSATLEKHLSDGQAKIHKDLAAGLLSEVLDGFNASSFTKNRIRNFVKDYKAAQRAKQKGSRP